MFQHILDAPIVSLGLGNGSNGHSPNEYFDLAYFRPTVDTAIHFLFNMAERAKGS
jgi:acetylornithine deacetylase/succinyl-diaminopimelate desuccinylase-like protein